ncbi:hypothetical protein D3C72_968650 [compost metagenome]
MQVGEIDFSAGRAIKAFHVGGQLDQVTGNEARRQPEVAQQLHQQPRGVTARAGGLFEGEFGGLHAWLHADQVIDVFTQALVERDEEIHGGQWRTIDAVQIGLEFWRQGQGFQVRRQFLALVRGISERDFFCVGFEEEIEGVEDRHFGQQVDFDPQFVGLFRKHQPRQVIALRVLLPVDEMLLGRDFQRIGEYPRATVGSRTQTNNLWTQLDSAVIAVMRDVVQCDMNRHGVPPASPKRIRKRARLMPSSGAGAFSGYWRQYSTKIGRCGKLVQSNCTNMSRRSKDRSLRQLLHGIGVHL